MEKTTEKIKEIMYLILWGLDKKYDHLKMLADTAEDCMDEDLESITSAMVSTAKFLTESKSDEEK